MTKTFKKPDLKAPRFREKSVHILNIELYKKFKKKFPEHNIDYGTFKKIIHTYNTQLADGIIDNRDGIELPEGLGYIFIGSCPQMTKRVNIDYKKSSQYGIITSHRNWESDNKVMKIFFTNSHVKYKLKNKQIWGFVANRYFRRKASKNYLEDWNKYVFVNNNKKISMLFKESMNLRSIRFKNMTSEVSEDYNEFDL